MTDNDLNKETLHEENNGEEEEKKNKRWLLILLLLLLLSSCTMIFFKGNDGGNISPPEQPPIVEEDKEDNKEVDKDLDETSGDEASCIEEGMVCPGPIYPGYPVYPPGHQEKPHKPSAPGKPSEPSKPIDDGTKYLQLKKIGDDFVFDIEHGKFTSQSQEVLLKGSKIRVDDIESGFQVGNIIIKDKNGNINPENIKFTDRKDGEGIFLKITNELGDASISKNIMSTEDVQEFSSTLISNKDSTKGFITAEIGFGSNTPYHYQGLTIEMDVKSIARKIK